MAAAAGWGDRPRRLSCGREYARLFSYPEEEVLEPGSHEK
jgi:hypothetical protein